MEETDEYYITPVSRVQTHCTDITGFYSLLMFLFLVAIDAHDNLDFIECK